MKRPADKTKAVVYSPVRTGVRFTGADAVNRERACFEALSELLVMPGGRKGMMHDYREV